VAVVLTRKHVAIDIPVGPRHASRGWSGPGAVWAVPAGLAAMALGGRGVRAAWITDRAVRLTGVNDAFARSIEAGPAAPVIAPVALLQTAKYLPAGRGAAPGGRR